MPDTTNPIGFTDANELREKNRATVEKYMNTKGQDRLRRHELFVEDGCDEGGRTVAAAQPVRRGRLRRKLDHGKRRTPGFPGP